MVLDRLRNTDAPQVRPLHGTVRSRYCTIYMLVVFVLLTCDSLSFRCLWLPSFICSSCVSTSYAAVSIVALGLCFYIAAIMEALSSGCHPQTLAFTNPLPPSPIYLYICRDVGCQLMLMLRLNYWSFLLVLCVIVCVYVSPGCFIFLGNTVTNVVL